MPPVEVIRTVDAVTAPVLAVCPNVLTQSPTASADDVVDWVCVNVVELDEVTFSACDAGFLVLLVLLEGRVKFSRIPVMETFDPLTAMTLPLAMDRLVRPAKPRCPLGPPPEPPGLAPPGPPK